MIVFSYFYHSKAVMFHTECCVNDVCNIVFKHPLQRGEQIGINCFDVIETDAFVEEHLVEWHGEASVNVVAMKESNAHDASNKVEV